MNTWWLQFEHACWGRDGIKVEARYAAVVTLRNGCILEWQLYQERDEALEAVGLAE